MNIAIGIGLAFVAAFLAVWSINVSFGAHIQKKPKDLWYMHFMSFILMFLAVIATINSARLLS